MTDRQLSGSLIQESEIKPTTNYDAWRIPRHTPKSFASLTQRDKFSYLIQCAILAPSTHNTQPWFFMGDSTKETITVSLDKSRVLPASDIVGRQACVSIGAATANMLTAANYFGYEPQITFGDVSLNDAKPSSNQDRIPLLEITLSLPHREPIVDDQTFSALFTRSVNRGLYDKSKLTPPEVIDVIKEIAATTKVQTHILRRDRIEDHLRIQAIAELQYQADSAVINNQRFTRELGNWFLPNNTSSGLGMPGDTFGVTAELAEKFHQGLKGEISIESAEKAALARAGKDGIESASLVAIMTVDTDTPSEWVRAGIAFGKTALSLEANGMSLAVHAGLAEVSIVRRGLALGRINSSPVLLFRAGFSERKNPHSPRLSFDKVSTVS